MVLYFKKIKFRKFIRKCGILDNLNIQSFGFSNYNYIKKGLHDWEREILKDEMKRKEREKEEREIQQLRKQFFLNWKIK